jgi:aryl-alcohol dehydrogenase
MIRSIAAIARGPGTDFTVEQVIVDRPRADEVRVRIVGVGICHTDLVFRDGGLLPMPAVLGHEGSGIVESVGASVTKVVPGDRVVLSFRSCGACVNCYERQPAYCSQFSALNVSGRRTDGSCSIHAEDGSELSCNFFGQSTFAGYALTYERNVVKVPPGAPLELLGPLGCGVQTGAGATMRALACQAGSSLLIIGAGPVGMSALLGAVVQDCATIIVSDPVKARRELARELGATHVIDPTVTELAAAVRAITPNGVNYAFDTSGRADVIATAIQSLAARGAIGLVGMPNDPATMLSAHILTLIGLGVTIRGIVEGDSDPDEFIPQLIELSMAGKFPIERLITTYPLRDINRAVADQTSGKCLKAVLLTESVQTA